jgi:hypothetical protein
LQCHQARRVAIVVGPRIINFTKPDIGLQDDRQPTVRGPHLQPEYRQCRRRDQPHRHPGPARQRGAQREWGDLLGLADPAVSWNNSGLLSLSNGRFLSWSSSVPCVRIVSGRALLQGNYFTDSVGMAIKTETTIDRVMVLGNMLCGNTVSLAGSTITSANNQP